MARLRLDLSYDGAGFHGWAAQDGLRTVEGTVTDALATILRKTTRLSVAGRTDAGVHAVAQVAHVDVAEGAVLRLTAKSEEPTQFFTQLRDRINRLLAAEYGKRQRSLSDHSLLPQAPKGACDVVINQITRVSKDFDARFSALARHYRYSLVVGADGRNPLQRGYRWWVPYGALDVEAMNKAAAVLVGTHDFLSFCRPREGATTIRSLSELRVIPGEEPGLLHIEVSADAFCHSMVRTLVGGLVEVGRGTRHLDWVRALVQCPSRDHGVPVAPPHGLSLVGVDYPPEEEWAKRSAEARRTRSSSETDECCGDRQG